MLVVSGKQPLARNGQAVAAIRLLRRLGYTPEEVAAAMRSHLPQDTDTIGTTVWRWEPPVPDD